MCGVWKRAFGKGRVGHFFTQTLLNRMGEKNLHLWPGQERSHRPVACPAHLLGNKNNDVACSSTQVLGYG
jgi:hypothetical protein